ncbi:MAG TPA: DUF5996 family protein [Roseiflexaceae bacterium]|nr:DUF5996 family protein [Roseiflexaceae bacterium]
MTSLPALANWERSSDSLHEAAMLLGAIRQLARAREANYLELAMRVERTGLSTDTLPGGGVVLFDFERAALTYTPKAGTPITIPLAGQSQASLIEALLIAMDTRGEGLLARPDDQWSFTQALLMRLDRGGHPFKPKPGELTNDAQLTIDARVSAEYAQALDRIFTAMARFRARLAGPQTPIVVWPEHFDLSTLWFPTNDRSDEAKVMNFGFAPFDGATERPYLYAYAYPMPEGFEQLPLPAPASWHTEGWKGMFVAYDDLARADDPEALIEALFEHVYALLAPTLR